MAEAVSKYREKKKQLKVDNALCTSPIPRLASDVTKNFRTGRKKKYTPTTMRNQINRYFEWCEKEDEIPSVKGLMIHLKMYKDMFYTYMTYPEFSDMMEHTRLIISNWAENDVYATKGMAAGKIAYMKNVQGWSDKIETKNESTTITLTVDQARARIEHLAPKLLEVLKSQFTVNQIAAPVVEAEVINPKRI